MAMVDGVCLTHFAASRRLMFGNPCAANLRRQCLALQKTLSYNKPYWINWQFKYSIWRIAMFQDPFERTTDSPTAPAEDCFAIVPSETADLPRATKAIYIGLSGDVTLIPVRGTTPVVFKKLAAGTILDVRVRAIRVTGTTAGDLVGLA